MMLVTASIACFALAQNMEAGVTWLASDDGTDLTLTTDGGSFNAGATLTDGTSPFVGAHWTNDTSQSFYGTGNVNTQSAGTTSGLDPWIVVGIVGTGTGHSFGYFTTNLVWDTGFGDTPGVFTPVTTMTFAGVTVATAFGTNLDAGAVTLWTHGTTGDTISVAKVVPEPSSMVMVSLSLAILMLRRRQGS